MEAYAFGRILRYASLGFMTILFILLSLHMYKYMTTTPFFIYHYSNPISTADRLTEVTDIDGGDGGVENDVDDLFTDNSRSLAVENVRAKMQRSMMDPNNKIEVIDDSKSVESDEKIKKSPEVERAHDEVLEKDDKLENKEAESQKSEPKEGEDVKPKMDEEVIKEEQTTTKSPKIENIEKEKDSAKTDTNITTTKVPKEETKELKEDTKGLDKSNETEERTSTKAPKQEGITEKPEYAKNIKDVKLDTVQNKTDVQEMDKNKETQQIDIHKLRANETLDEKMENSRIKRSAVLATCDDGKYETMRNMSYIKLVDMPKSFTRTHIGDYINLMEETPPPFLKNYKNPCWREEIKTADSYKDNFYNVQKWPSLRLPPAEIFQKRMDEGVYWKLRCLPYFYFIGFVKCGTTHIYNGIRFHPGIVDVKKEFHWWTRFRNSKLIDKAGEAAPIKHYIDLFDTPSLQIDNIIEKHSGKEDYHPAFFGDASTLTATEQWMWWTHPENKGRELGRHAPRFINAHYIQHITPHAKIIVAMRDPVNRLYSQFTMHHGPGPEGFHDHAVLATTRMSECIKNHGLSACVAAISNHTFYKFTLRDSMYYAFVEQWLKVFPREQFHFVKLEDFGRHSIYEINKIFRFLGVSEIADQTLPVDTYTNKYKLDQQCENCTALPMLEKTRKYLKDWFRPFNQKLADLLQDKRWLFE